MAGQNINAKIKQKHPSSIVKTKSFQSWRMPQINCLVFIASKKNCFYNIVDWSSVDDRKEH